MFSDLPVDGATRIRTADPDLGATLALWCRPAIDEFLRATPGGSVVIEDDGVAGRPVRTGRPRDFGERRAWRDGAVAHIRTSSSDVILPARPHVTFLRKAMVRAGLAYDACSLDQRQVLGHQRRLMRAVRAGLGLAASAAPARFLLRVDDFPASPGSLDSFARFHAIARDHAVPYLLAVTPFAEIGGGAGRLTDEAAATLRACATEGAELAVHGFRHVSRYRNYANELLGVPVAALNRALDRAAAHFRDHGFAPIGFVPPFNGFDPVSFQTLADRFAVIGGGPESVGQLGYRAGPSFLGGALYVPSYRHAYDLPLGDLRAFDRMAAGGDELTIPVTLHWANDAATGFAGFRALCARLRDRTDRWSDLAQRAAAIRQSAVQP